MNNEQATEFDNMTSEEAMKVLEVSHDKDETQDTPLTKPAPLNLVGNKTQTENGAAAFKSTGNNCLDLFALIGAMRDSSDIEVSNLFTKAFIEDNLIATKIAFFARDIREGLGERRVFRTMLKTLAKLSPETMKKNLENVAEFGRYDDLLCLLSTSVGPEVFNLIEKQLKKDLATDDDKPVSLLGKWLPSINTSSKEACVLGNKLTKALGMTNKQYRKGLAKLRKKINIIENNLRTKNYDIDYSKLPSRALFKYRNAFQKHDEDSYFKFFREVENGETKINTNNLYPYELIRPFLDFGVPDSLTEENRKIFDITWKNLPDYTNNENAIVVADVSGSMFGGQTIRPIDVSISLALYFAERNKGLFANRFITFSDAPELVTIKGKDIFEKIQYCQNADWGGSTNIISVFKSILKEAVANHATAEEIPTKIYIISDMEFNQCVDDYSKAPYEKMKAIFEKNGYSLPQIVFWRVNVLSKQLPVTKDENGVALVSGCSPTIFKLAMSKDINPYNYMIDVLNSPRYERIACA